MIEQVVHDAGQYPFTSLVALIEQLLAAPALVGGDGPIYDEAIRFRHDPSLGFHTGDISHAALVIPRGAAPYVELTTTFAGLTGSVSPLPPGMLEDIAQSDDSQSVQRDLLDGFHHRLLGLLYRGLVRSDFTRAHVAGSERGIVARLLLLAGIPPERAEDITGLAVPQLMRLLPLLVGHPPNARRLRLAVADVFSELLDGADVRVVPLVGGMVRVDAEDLPKLGVDLALGRNSALGRCIAVPASLARLVVGPLSAEACAALAPDGACFQTLCSVVALFAPPTVDVDVELLPRAGRPTQLGTRAGSRLGRNAWLGRAGAPKSVRFRAV